MIKRLSFVLRLIDGCMNKALTGSEASIWIDGIKQRHEYKPNGYFVVADLKEGDHFVAVKSPKFQTETMTVNIGYSHGLPAEKRVCYLKLNPSEFHPEAVRSPRITGRAAGAQKLYIMCTKGELKIAEDAVEAGNTSIKMFCSGTRPQLPSVFRIKDKIDSYSEIVTLKDADGDVYTLGEALAFPHRRSSAVIPLIRLLCTESGYFFFVIPPEFQADKSGKIRLKILAECGGALMQTELIADSAGKTDLGDIKLKKGG